MKSEQQLLEGRHDGSDSHSLAANALIPIVQEMGTVTSYQKARNGEQLLPTSGFFSCHHSLLTTTQLKGREDASPLAALLLITHYPLK